jgi:hypothetical protein
MTAVSMLGVALGGCTREEPVLVRIYPDRYETDGVQSSLATPVVDAVVRRQPKVVHIFQCMSGTIDKSNQFWTELNARHKAQIEGGFLPNEDCQ